MLDVRRMRVLVVTNMYPTPERPALGPFVREDGTSIDMDGENLRLKPDAVQNLGFALFELGTNAVKYGALSAEGGQVAISWTVRRPSIRQTAWWAAGESRWKRPVWWSWTTYQSSPRKRWRWIAMCARSRGLMAATRYQEGL